MDHSWTRYLRLTFGLLSLTLLTASLAPADVQWTQFAQAPPQSQDRAGQRAPAKQQAPPKVLSAPPATPTPAAAPAPPPAALPPNPASAPAPTPPATPVKAAPFATLSSQQPVASAKLNMVRTAPEQLGQVPGHFFWIRKGVQAAQDPVDGDIVFLNDEGRVLGRAKLPAGFIIADVFPDAKDVRLIDASRRQILVPRTIDPAGAGTLQPTATNGKNTRAVRVTRRSNEELVFQDQRRSGSRALTIRSLAGGMLGQAYEIGSGSGDKRYLVSEEIVAVTPAMKVRVFVQRFDSAGKLTGVVHVPLEGMDSVPRDFIAITDQGNARVLVPGDSGVTINEIEFALPPKAERRLNEDEVRGLGRLLRTIPVDSNALGEKRSQLQRDVPALEIVTRLPPIKRDAILLNARAYLTVNWVMQRENFSKSGIDNECAPDRGKFWRRPYGFTAAMVGTTIGPMPYRWGGDDTPDTFHVRTKLGALAGDICTCRSAANNYCLVAGSAGVDCSGFVSRAWGIEKRGTSGLMDVSQNVGSLGDLKPGDAFNWPGRHVRLLVAPSPGATLSFTVLESSTRRDCEGVCERTYRPSELSGYRLIRYRGATDSDAATAEVKR